MDLSSLLTTKVIIYAVTVLIVIIALGVYLFKSPSGKKHRKTKKKTQDDDSDDSSKIDDLIDEINTKQNDEHSDD